MGRAARHTALLGVVALVACSAFEHGQTPKRETHADGAQSASMEVGREPSETTVQSTMGEPPFPGGLGVGVPLEDPSGRALDAFHRALGRTEAGHGQTRVLFHGASHTAADHYVGHLRAALQQRFGDGGRGFTIAAWPNTRHHYWQWGVQVAKGYGWDRLRLGRSRGTADYYGVAGIVFDSGGRSALAHLRTPARGVGARANRIDVFYQEQPGGGELEVRVDEGVVRRVSTHARQSGAGVVRLEVEDRPHRVELRALPGAPVRVYGVSLERDTAGVIVHNAALTGSRARDHRKWLGPVYEQHLRHLHPDLFVVAYGGNEGNDFRVPINRYARNLAATLQRIRRALPEASCLLLGAADKPLRRGDDWVHRARTSSIARVQRRLAFEQGCAFFDTVAFMGGRMSMLRWVAAAPPLAHGDHVHLSARGYRRLGQVLLDGLLAGYAGAPRDPSRQTSSLVHDALQR